MISCEGLTKRYGERVAVDDVSFDVRPGVVTGFLGPNGAGKSTTMRLMLDLDGGEGHTLFDGRRFRDLPDPAQQVGAMLEAKAFHPTRTARNHLRLLTAGAGLPDRRADEVLELVGLAEVARKRPGTFSLGMAQRLGLAAALLGDPATLVLDEPANGLDPQGIRWLRSMLKDYASAGRAVFVSSHLLSEMEVLADELVVIGRGRLVARGTVAGLVERSGGNAVVARTPDAARLATVLEQAGATIRSVEGDAVVAAAVTADVVGRAAFASGICLLELSNRRASLEDAFLALSAGMEEHVAAGPTAGPGR
jgi:ABC-2 type transport system ATP-binding protein